MILDTFKLCEIENDTPVYFRCCLYDLIGDCLTPYIHILLLHLMCCCFPITIWILGPYIEIVLFYCLFYSSNIEL